MTNPPKLPEALPDVPLGKWILRDRSNISRQDWGKAKVILQEMWMTQVPPEVQCNLDGTKLETLSLVQGRGASAVAAFRALESKRVNEEMMMGQLYPISFALYEGEEVVGAWQWYGIHLLGAEFHDDGSLKAVNLRAMPYPAFQRTGLDIPGQARLLADVAEVFLAHPGLEIAGVWNKVTEVMTFSYTHPDIESEAYQMSSAWDAETDRRSNDPVSRITTEVTHLDWGGQQRTLRWE